MLINRFATFIAAFSIEISHIQAKLMLEYEKINFMIGLIFEFLSRVE